MKKYRNQILISTFIVFMSVLTMPLFVLAQDDIITHPQIFHRANTERILVRIPKNSINDFNALNLYNVDKAAYNPSKYLDVVIPYFYYSFLIQKGIPAYIKATESELSNNLSLRSRLDMTGYNSYTSMLQTLNEIAGKYPNLCKLYNWGDTWGNYYYKNGTTAYKNYQHNIWAIKLSDNVELEEDEPSLYFMGGHHAREPISVEVVLALLKHIVSKYETDAEIKTAVNEMELWFVPLLNPDGHSIVITKQDIWWRKNIRDNDKSKTRNDNDGVDLNRNYSFQWGLTGSSDNIDNETFHGVSAFSEIESCAVRDFFSVHKFVAGIAYHSYGELVLFPYGYSYYCKAPDYNALKYFAEQIASVTNGYSGKYEAIQSSDMYAAMGDHSDYAYGNHGIFSFTIELANTFIPPTSDISGICNSNILGAMKLFKMVNTNLLTGHVYDLETGEPLIAEINIEQIDSTGDFRYPYYSDSKFGRFNRILLPGTYTLTVKAEGYKTKTISNILIEATAKKVIEISLDPIYALSDIISLLNFLAYDSSKPYKAIDMLSIDINTDNRLDLKDAILLIYKLASP